MKIFALGFYLAIIVSLFPSASTGQITVQKVLNLLDKKSNNANKKQQTTNTNSQHTTNTDPQLPDKNTTDKNTNNVSSSTSAPNGLKAGDVAPDAVYIDADQLYPFNGGAAIVKKGDATALIDKIGKFIVPYNKYDFGLSLPDGYSLSYSGSIYNSGSIYTPSLQSGIFLLREGIGAINSKGELITKGLPSLVWSYNSPVGQFIRAIDQKHHIFYMDAKGDKYILNSSKIASDFVVSEGAVIEESQNKYGYKNLKDEWIVQPIYDAAKPFSDGLACVGKKDEFGEWEYGFINKKGKVVIPFIYSNQPTDFHGGVALVIPKSKAEFAEAYIDKQGNIIKKFKLPYSLPYIGYGYYGGSGVNTLMDSTGNIVTVTEFLKSYGVVSDPSTFGISVYQFNDGKIFYTRFFKNSGVPSNEGYVNIRTKKIVEGAFTFFNVGVLNFSDKESKLAYASIYTSKIHDQDHLREGYINEDGVFVIVKKAASVF